MSYFVNDDNRRFRPVWMSSHLPEGSDFHEDMEGLLPEAQRKARPVQETPATGGWYNEELAR